MGGAAAGALYVADVYCGAPTGGSASAVARALAWMAREEVGVINVSLVGPANRALEAAIRAAQARGHIIVAAVGNDGPAARPLFPAAYDGVVGVTAVDRRRRVLLEAGRGAHVDFAALGSDFSAASPGGGFASVRGTSFAAPVVARVLARSLDRPDPATAARALSELAQSARDLGARGRDNTYGAGLIGAQLIRDR
jgi:subtilisin family serine protease